MSDTENNPQQPETDEQTSAGETQDESSDLKAPVESDPPIIVHGDGSGTP
jgi:hypothetical protein